MDSFSYANLANASFIEGLYQSYLSDPQSVDISWQRFFEGVQFAVSDTTLSPKEQLEGADLRVYFLIRAYRRYGHKLAGCNPLYENTCKEHELLLPVRFGFTDNDMEQMFPTYGILPTAGAMLKEIIEAVKKIYCGSVAYEFMHVENEEILAFIAERIEGRTTTFSSDEQKSFYDELVRAEGLETYIQRNYQGKKRFSLEGGETLIPMMTKMIESFGDLGVKEVRIGMAHRGRLNVLANTMGKPFSIIFYEFEGYYIPEPGEGAGDVKYHKGYDSDHTTRNGKQVHISLEANPSHLEAVNPVVEGTSRAKQDLVYGNFDDVVPILIHGDASLAGQGVVYETMQFYNLEGYKTGGTVHIVVNNQIGFTANPDESRSTPYCTDIALPFGAPVFHVNAEDPETCIAVMRLAAEIRQKFACDVFVDLNCYRKYGHSETDEPGFTQPITYQKIKDRKMIREMYRDKLLQSGALSEEEASQIEAAFRDELQSAKEEMEKLKSHPPEVKELSCSAERIDTTVSEEILFSLTEKFSYYPENFHIHPKLKRLYGDRVTSVKSGEKKIDWGTAEHLAFASLLIEGHPVRISGEDSKRGTFSHRHSAIVDQTNEETYIPLSHLDPNQAPFYAYNSSLSEYAVMGFEFGYSMQALDALVIWEAQFGDFANGAQIMIDQFISGSEQKWGRLSHIVLFLPHGFEGMGPEHSSARLERFLQLAGDDNMNIVVPTHPAQVFHLFRNQAKSQINKPLIFFSPKGLLRYGPSLSQIDDFTKGGFLPVIDDPAASGKILKVIFCTGKVYYDLILEREKRKAVGVAFVRLEKLYPFPEDEVCEIIKKYSDATAFMWVQEEHLNMGAWSFVEPLLRSALPDNQTLCYVGRNRSATTGAGNVALHEREKEAFLNEAFA
jgi:2-oxoglutarate dehydrogenase E1 component